MIYTDINYPDGLPCAQREGYSLRHVSPFMRTEMDSGRARQRRKFSSVPTMASVAWVFENDTQAAAFEAWFREAINDGVEWFNMPLKTPVGLKDYVCRFTDMYEGPDLIGVSSWRISAQLEIWERPLMPDGWGLLPEFALGSSIFDIAMNREWPLFRFDFETYQEAMNAFDTLTDGQTITVRDVGGKHALYRVRRNTGPSLSMDFANQIYFITDGPDALILVNTWQ